MSDKKKKTLMTTGNRDDNTNKERNCTEWKYEGRSSQTGTFEVRK
jgi:hypothetical protein